MPSVPARCHEIWYNPCSQSGLDVLLHRNFHHLVLVFDLRHIHHLAKLLGFIGIASMQHGWPRKESVIHMFNFLLALVTILLYWIVFYCTFVGCKKKSPDFPYWFPPLAPKRSWQVDAFCTFWIIGTCTWVWTGTSTTCRGLKETSTTNKWCWRCGQMGSCLTKLLHIGFHEGSCLGPWK